MDVRLTTGIWVGRPTASPHATSTVSPVVTLNNSYSGTPTSYMASESAGFSGASWLPYSSAPAFTLSAGNGTKTVYFIVKNVADMVSAVASDTILR